MHSSLKNLEKHERSILKLLPLVAFVLPLMWLYSMEPATFEVMWKGRTFQLFFLWLVMLELILGWETLQSSRLRRQLSVKTIAFILSMALPSLYIASSQYGGLNTAISNWAIGAGITWANSMPLSIEYLAFAVVFCAIVFIAYGFNGIKAFSVPAFFLVIVGIIYTVDNIFPYGQFTPFQIFVPTTTTLAAAIMNFMGYGTTISYVQNTPTLTATDPHTLASATFSIAWPCAGIESFLIFTVVILLFLKRMPISLKSKICYFVFGASVTYVINSLRIVDIFMTGMVYGENSIQVQNVHFYYGPLYAVAWIVTYPLLILLSQSLWQRIRTPKQVTSQVRPALPNPA